jgi:large subunit ribosomal protein L34
LFFNANLIFDLIRVLGYALFMSQTYQPKKRKRAKAHGFLVRSKSKNGKQVLARRRKKGRAKLSV